MTNWIASSNRNNWEIIRKNNIWGIPKRNKVLHSRVKQGDNILFFIRSQKHGQTLLPSVITGVFLVKYCYEDQSQIFFPPPHMGDEVFPYRIRLIPFKVFSEPVEFKPLIEKLGFITNKIIWSGHLRTALREIPEEDYQYILKKGSNQ